MTQDYFYDHAWTQERIRLAGLEAALDQGTHEHLTRLGAALGGVALRSVQAVARWLSGSLSASLRTASSWRQTSRQIFSQRRRPACLRCP
jgi:hypothetical protein